MGEETYTLNSAQLKDLVKGYVIGRLYDAGPNGMLGGVVESDVIQHLSNQHNARLIAFSSLVELHRSRKIFLNQNPYHARIAQPNDIEFVKSDVYDYIKEHPGISFNELVIKTGYTGADVGAATIILADERKISSAFAFVGEDHKSKAETYLPI